MTDLLQNERVAESKQLGDVLHGWGYMSTPAFPEDGDSLFESITCMKANEMMRDDVVIYMNAISYRGTCWQAQYTVDAATLWILIGKKSRNIKEAVKPPPRMTA